jgi:hypothetical protein
LIFDFSLGLAVSVICGEKSALRHGLLRWAEVPAELGYVSLELV